MFEILCHAKYLTLDSGTIEILSKNLDLLEHQLSPFIELKWLKVQPENERSTVPGRVKTYLLSSSPGAIVLNEIPKIAVDRKTVASPSVGVNVRVSDPLSNPLNTLQFGNKITKVNMDVIVAEELGSSDCSNSPTTTIHARHKDVASQPADSIPFVCQNLDEDMVRNKEVLENLLFCTGEKVTRASTVEPVHNNIGDLKTLQSGVTPVLDELGDAKDEHLVEINSDAEQVGPQNGHAKVGTIFENTAGVRAGEEHSRQQNAGAKTGNATKQEFSEGFSVNIFGNVQENCGFLSEVNRVVSCAPIAGGKNKYCLSGNTDNCELRQVVHPDFVDLLDLIREKYPETFEPFTRRGERVSTLSLNTLCTAIKSFSNVSTIEVTAETINQYRNLFAFLERYGFNIKWLVDYLNCIEKLRFSSPLVDEIHPIDCQLEKAQREVRELQAFRVAKMAELQDGFGYFSAKLAAGHLGDGLFNR